MLTRSTQTSQKRVTCRPGIPSVTIANVRRCRRRGTGLGPGTRVAGASVMGAARSVRKSGVTSAKIGRQISRIGTCGAIQARPARTRKIRVTVGSSVSKTTGAGVTLPVAGIGADSFVLARIARA